ncbi:MAG: DnaJ domain-containing protein [Microthrixaceae bacterium]|nr:DnaJ domain-containing protein [Microthrixaceae bacterium]MCO5311704.1 DnaJ domain-containing protein [Microthrixaceae bacterium]
MASSYYDTLGVSRNATSDEIQKAYRKLARVWHPDVNQSSEAEDRFKAISEAYDVLSDAETRKRYDAFGADFRKVPPGTDPAAWARAQRGATTGNGGGFGGGGFSGGFGSAFGGGGGGGGGFEDLLGGLFGQGRRSSGPQRGADQDAEIILSLEEAFGGGERQVTMSGPTGVRNITVKIPVGVTAGQKIRVRGEGGPGSGGGPAGDLLLKVKLAPDPTFTVDGRDLSVTLAVSPWEAALGAKATVPTLSGPAQVKVPPGSSSGKRLRLRGRGLPNRRGDDGDLYAVISIVVPESLTDREADLFEQLAQESLFKPRGV